MLSDEIVCRPNTSPTIVVTFKGEGPDRTPRYLAKKMCDRIRPERKRPSILPHFRMNVDIHRRIWPIHHRFNQVETVNIGLAMNLRRPSFMFAHLSTYFLSCCYCLLLLLVTLLVSLIKSIPDALGKNVHFVRQRRFF